jgi:hypothetical protein
MYINVKLSTCYMTQTRDLPKIVVAAYRFLPYFIFDGQEGEATELLPLYSLCIFWYTTDILFWIPSRF